MRYLTAILMLTLGATAPCAELFLSVTDAPAAGTLVVQVYDSPNAFGDFRNPVREFRVELADGPEHRFSDVPPGTLAVLAYVDQNDNGFLDKNFIGIPREVLGISNNYRPKGPPAFRRASFELPADGTKSIEIELFRVLGDRGQLGVGIGVVGQSSPYVGSSETVLQPIPAITYNGERLQWLGPNVQYGVAGSGKFRLAVSASYRIGAYEEDDSPILEGLGDRDGTLLAGLGVRYEIPGGINLLARYEHDVLDRIGGGQGRLRFSKGFQAGIVRLIPQLAVNWLSEDLANYEFGVPPSAATPERPAWDVGSTVSVEVGFGSFIELTEDWRVILNLAVEQFDDSVGDSPIVDTDRVVRGFAAITYVF